MDISSTVSTVRKEYKEYLRKKHPNWAENKLKAHVSDAFYLWNHTLIPSFWKSMVDDDSMQSAKRAIHAYFQYELMSEKAEECTEAYFIALQMLKEFLDKEYGGVRNRIGKEFDCEVIIYQYAKEVFEKQCSLEEAVLKLTEKVPYYNETSHKITIMVFLAMMKGQKYTYRANTEVTLYFIRQIGEMYGLEFMKKALYATRENIRYFYEQTGAKSNSFLRGCRKIAEKYEIEITLDESLFDGIIPKQTPVDDVLADSSAVRYWMYSPRKDWEKMYHSGIMVMERDYLGDPMLFTSQTEMQNAMQNCGMEKYTTTYRNATLEIWQFVHEMKSGDIVIVKKGAKSILGRGVVISEFIYDEKQPQNYRYYRKIAWTHKGEWEHPKKALPETLTDITRYIGYVEELHQILQCTQEENAQKTLDSYTEADFLNDVYMEETRYRTLKTLLLTKKNIILQGAPGVGKTYTAKRLAFSIMGEKDNSRVKMVQFHQSYSYEDFIMGFRPTENGFSLKKGVFYEFCCKAAEDDRPYFFIIDEINRGNLSKIFGELFMLLENDKRGVELQLLYAEEQFSIPSNVHIIGMMNTADRSLAMLDYALRRRFAFFEMKPAFDTSGFRTYQAKVNDVKFDKLITLVKELNEEIANDDSLGEGFCIGHSYFCTKTTINDEWMKSVVEFELLPLLKEYWFDEPAKVRGWSKVFQEVFQ